MREQHITKNESVAHLETYISTQSFLTLCQSFLASTSSKIMYVQSFLTSLPGEVQLAGASLYRVYQTSLAVN